MVTDLMKRYLPLIIILLGAVGVYGVWNMRYNSAYLQGVVDGNYDGNRTGMISGLEDGYQDGYDEGYDEGIEIGKSEGVVEGYDVGYSVGYSDGLAFGYGLGFDDGYSVGNSSGYIAGVDFGSSNCTVRDPTWDEVLKFIEADDTDSLFESGNYSSEFLLSYIKKNAYDKRYRLLWVNVRVLGLPEGRLWFCGFNTTNGGMLVFNHRHDIFLDLQVGELCFDREVWAEPSYDDTITKIEYTP